MVTVYDDFEVFTNSISVEYDKLTNLTNILDYLEKADYTTIASESFSNEFDNVMYNLKTISGEEISFEGLSEIGEKIKYVIGKIYKFIKTVLIKIKDIIVKAFTTIINLIKKMLGQTKTVKEHIDSIKIKYPKLYRKDVVLTNLSNVYREHPHLYSITKKNMLDVHTGLTRLSINIALIANIMEVTYPGLEIGRELIKNAVLLKNEYDNVIDQMGNKIRNVVDDNYGSVLNKPLAFQALENQGDNSNRYTHVVPLSINNGILHYMYIRKETTDRVEVYYGEGDIEHTDLFRSMDDSLKCSLEKIDKIISNMDKDTDIVNKALSILEKAQKRTADRLELLLEAANNKLNNRTILEPFPSLCRDLVAYSNNTVSPLITKEYINMVSYVGKVLSESVKLITIFYNLTINELKDEEK